MAGLFFCALAAFQLGFDSLANEDRPFVRPHERVDTIHRLAGKADERDLCFRISVEWRASHAWTAIRYR